MPSNTSLRHVTSETNLSPKSHLTSPASPRDTTVPSSSKLPSSSNTVTNIKLRRKGPDLRAYDHHHQIITHHEQPSLSSVSPYYKGLLYQPLPKQNHLNGGRNNNNSNSRVPISEASPYYKGLTDFSLAIHGGQHLESQEDYGFGIPEVEGAYECSPYFRGLLTDSSLAKAIRKLDEGGGGGGRGGSRGQGGVMPISFSSLNMNLCLGGNKDEILNNNTAQTQADLGRQRTLSPLSPPAPIPLPSPSLPLPPPPLSMFPSKGDFDSEFYMRKNVLDQEK